MLVSIKCLKKLIPTLANDKFKQKEIIMKFTKTVEFDLYTLGDKPVEGVMFNVDLAITDENKCICTNATPDEMGRMFLERIGGPGAPDYWKGKVIKYFQDESHVFEELGENMTDEEYNQWESILMDK